MEPLRAKVLPVTPPIISFLTMLATVQGSATAAKALGYRHMAGMILEEEMKPDQIARLFRLSASKEAGRHAALIILAGSIALLG